MTEHSDKLDLPQRLGAAKSLDLQLGSSMSENMSGHMNHRELWAGCRKPQEGTIHLTGKAVKARIA
jgi:hypothetical protein